MELRLPAGRRLFIPAVEVLSLLKLREASLLTDYLDPKNNERILDVGCGAGYLTHRIAKRCASIAGVDINISPVRIGLRHFADGRCRFLVCAGEALPFAPGSFDKVISICALEHFNSDVAGLREMNRVLKPGHVLAISVDSLSSPYIAAEDRRNHAQTHAVNNFYKLDTLKARLAEAGFELLEYRYLLTSRVGYYLQRFYWSRRKLLFPLFPLFLLVSAFGDAVTSSDRHGFILAAKARKVREV